MTEVVWKSVRDDPADNLRYIAYAYKSSVDKTKKIVNNLPRIFYGKYGF
jgi:hypothetical protein